MKIEEQLQEVCFSASLGQHAIEGTVVNPGAWWGTVWLIQIAIANALNPFYAVEAGNEQDALDEFADSRFSHLIDVDEADWPKWDAEKEEEEESDYTHAGNDGHFVNLSNVHIQRAPVDLRYTIAWSPEQADLSAVVDSELRLVREAAEEEAKKA